MDTKKPYTEYLQNEYNLSPNDIISAAKYTLAPIMCFGLLFALYYSIMETHTVKKKTVQALRISFSVIGSVIGFTIIAGLLYYRSSLLWRILITTPYNTLLDIYNTSDKTPYIKGMRYILNNTLYFGSICYIFYYLYYVFINDVWLEEDKYLIPFIFSWIYIIASIFYYFMKNPPQSGAKTKTKEVSILMGFMASLFSLAIFCNFIYIDRIVSLKSFMGVILSICGISLFGNLQL